MVPVRDALREISTILLRREDRGRRGLGDRTAPSSESSSSSSSSNNDVRNGETDRGSEGGARVDKKSSLSDVNFAITCSKTCDSDSDSEVVVTSTGGGGGGVGGIDLPIVEDVVGRLSGVIVVVMRVGICPPSSRIVSCAVDKTSFVRELALLIESILLTVAIVVEVAVGGCRIAGSNPSNPAIKKKSANAATIVLFSYKVYFLPCAKVPPALVVNFRLPVRDV